MYTIRRAAEQARPERLANRLWQPTNHFCPRLDDKISVNANSTRASRSFAAGTPFGATNHTKQQPKTHRKMRFSKPIFASLCHLKKLSCLAFPAPFPPPPRQNHPILSPFSDFPTFATKFPLRNSSIQTTFVQPNCNDRIPPPLLAPYHNDPPLPHVRQCLRTLHSVPRTPRSPLHPLTYSRLGSGHSRDTQPHKTADFSALFTHHCHFDFASRRLRCVRLRPSCFEFVSYFAIRISDSVAALRPRYVANGLLTLNCPPGTKTRRQASNTLKKACRRIRREQ